MDEHDNHSGTEQIPLQIKDASFKWDENDTNPVLKDINVTVKKGQLVMVVGAVGSGSQSNNNNKNKIFKFFGQQNLICRYLLHSQIRL